MFERYTEPARRAVFYARYEASQLCSGYIEPVHLLLGLLREDTLLCDMLSSRAREEIRQHVERDFRGTGPVSTSVDLPLSQGSKQALALGAEEAQRLRHQHIDSAHLLLGLMRVKASPVEEILRKHGIEYEQVTRKLMSAGLPRPIPPPPAAMPELMVDPYLHDITEIAAGQRLKRLPLTRREALGHLIDWATALHQWIGRALVENKVVAHGYPSVDRAVAEPYADIAWLNLIAAWSAMDDLLSRLISRLPPEKLQTPCRIGIDAEIPLASVIERYREHTKDILAQICARGE